MTPEQTDRGGSGERGTGSPDGGEGAGPRSGTGVETGTVETNGIDTYYERRGEGRPVVFVHGAIMDHSMWTPQVEALADEYTTVAYDVRGHGRTGGSAVDPYSVELFAEDLDALLAELDLEKPVVCGLSMGGCIAQTYAARHPEKVAGLVLADTWAPEILDWRDRVQFGALRGTILPVRLFGYPRVQRVMTWAQDRFVDRGSRGDYERIERLQAEAPTMATDEFAKVIRAVARFTAVDVDLGAITAPTLVVYGENTAGVVERHVRKLLGEIPHAKYSEVPGGGHACNLDNPAFFSAALAAFLDELPPVERAV